MKNWTIAIVLTVLSGATFAGAVEDNYNKSCTFCHSSGAAGAPKTGDAAAWAPRMEKGMDALVASVNNGINAMPPKGMCATCTDEDFRALINYMSK